MRRLCALQGKGRGRGSSAGWLVAVVGPEEMMLPGTGKWRVAQERARPPKRIKRPTAPAGDKLHAVRSIARRAGQEGAPCSGSRCNSKSTGGPPLSSPAARRRSTQRCPSSQSAGRSRRPCRRTSRATCGRGRRGGAGKSTLLRDGSTRAFELPDELCHVTACG